MTPDSSQVLNGRYRLLDVVGEGGMAVVWRAEDVLLGRTVAIKILRDQYAADPEFVTRFRSEARAAAALNDPGIVAVHDVGEEAGRHYLVLEYVPGSDLKSIIRAEAPLSPERAVHIGATLARAVGAAHAIGLVHRDVKPQNVLVTPDGRMKVADFGIARAVSAVGSTAPGIVLGTVHYLSPEQATGGAATFASDVYALGVVMYEMLSGHVPFDADSAVGVAMKIAHEAPEPLGRRNPRVPAALVNIVDRAMAHDPATRYHDARALAEALDAYARWSEQATAGLVPPVAGKGAAPRAQAVAPRASSPAPTPARRAAGPLFDWTGLTLALVALAAVAGLIPLWMAVNLRSGQSPGSGGGVPTAGPSPTAEAVGGLPTPLAVANVAVPRVLDLTVEDASRLLASQDLAVTTEYTATNTVAPGVVVSQVPAPDTTVPAGSVVRLLVSGHAMVVVPELSGDYASVAAALERVHLVPRQVEEWGGADTAVGTILRIEPLPGIRVPQGSPVDIVVNSGSWLPLGVDFADHIHLPGVTLPRDVVGPGDPLAVSARWEAVEPVAGDYVARVSLLDGAGQAVAVAEHPPGGDRSTNTWQAGEVFADDHFVLTVPPEVVPGRYALVLELVARVDPGQRLDVLHSAYGRTDGPRVVVRDISVAAP